MYYVILVKISIERLHSLKVPKCGYVTLVRSGQVYFTGILLTKLKDTELNAPVKIPRQVLELISLWLFMILHLPS